MLHLLVHTEDGLWDERREVFIYPPDKKLTLEHSLVSLKKWESKWHKPFLSSQKEPKTREETIDYIKCMTLTQNVDPEVYDRLTDENIAEINRYIDDPMTATWFSEDESKPNKGQTVTAELIYYWMLAYNIPFECQKWHLNQLLTLIKVCKIKNEPPKKMSQKDVLSQYAALNAARKKKYGTKG